MVNNGLDQAWDGLMTADNRVESFLMRITYRIKVFFKLIWQSILRIWDMISIFTLKIVSFILGGSISLVKALKGKRAKKQSKMTDYEARIIEESKED
jgi:hypothetical protein